MVQILGLQQGAMHSAGKYWRYTELCEPVDVSADELVVSMIGQAWRTWRRRDVLVEATVLLWLRKFRSTAQYPAMAARHFAALPRMTPLTGRRAGPLKTPRRAHPTSRRAGSKTDLPYPMPPGSDMVPTTEAALLALAQGPIDITHIGQDNLFCSRC